MMKIQLEQLIFQTLEELKMLGMKKSTIKSYKYSAYSPIKNYCVQKDITWYHPPTLDTFLSFQMNRLENSEISKRHYRKLRKAVLMLQDIHQNGKLQWGFNTQGSMYTTNEYFTFCLKQYLVSQQLSKGTLSTNKSIILQFLNHIERNGHCDFSKLSPKDVRDYLTVIAERNQGSMGNVLYALRHFTDYLRVNSLVNKDFKPILNKPSHRKKRLLPYFTHEEVEIILNQIDTSTNKGKRDFAILILASHTGLRSIDIANLRLTDLDWNNDSIRIVQRKTGRPLVLPLGTNIGNAIATYILNARPESDSEYVFLRTVAPHKKLSDTRTLGGILEKYLHKAGITRKPNDRKSFHALRRSMGTWMLESGVPLTTISQVLGHREQDSSKQYLSMNHKGLAECALNFQGIPVERGIFL